MRQISLLVAAALLAAVGASHAGADDSALCYSPNSDAWKNEEYLDPALQACSRLIKSTSGPDQAAAYRARGYWKHRKRDYGAAIEDYNIAIEMEPTNIEGYNYRADTWRDMGELDHAIADYNISTGIDPRFAAGYFNRGRAYEMKGDIATARREYKAALAAPARNRLGEWAHAQARLRLSQIGW